MVWQVNCIVKYSWFELAEWVYPSGQDGVKVMINALPKKILILGGSGNTGRQIAGLLLQETGSGLVLAGRKLARAQAVTLELNQQHPGERVSAISEIGRA